MQDSDPGRYYHDLGEEFGDVERTRLLRSSTGLRSWALFLPFFFLMQAARSFKGQRAARYLELGLYVIEVVLMQPCPYQYPGESRIGTGFKVIKCVIFMSSNENHDLACFMGLFLPLVRDVSRWLCKG